MGPSSFLHLAYFIARFFIFFLTPLPYVAPKRPHCHHWIYRWQTISSDKGSDNLTKLFQQWNVSMGTAKRKPSVDFLFFFSLFHISLDFIFSLINNHLNVLDFEKWVS